MPPKQPSIVCALPPLFLIEFFPADTPHPNPRLPADAGPFRAQSEHLTSLVGKLSESVTPKAAVRDEADCRVTVVWPFNGPTTGSNL